MLVYPKKGCQVTAVMKQNGTAATFLAATPGRTTMAPSRQAARQAVDRLDVDIGLLQLRQTRNIIAKNVEEYL